MNAQSSTANTTSHGAKRRHPILQLPERFQNLSIQFGKEPELREIKAGNRIGGELSSPMESRMSDSDPAGRSAAHLDLTTANPGSNTHGPTASEPPFRLYDLVKLDPTLFWELYHARAYNDLLIRLTYERYLPEEKKGKTNYIESIHLTGTTFEPAKTNGFEFWHSVEDGEDDGLLQLSPDQNNTHDANAIRVLTASKQKQIGWIPAKNNVNQLVLRNYNLGCFNSAQLLKVETNPGKTATLGIQIAIGWTFPPEILQKYVQTA